MQQKNGKEPATGEEKIQLHLYYAIGPARGQEPQEPQEPQDISWPSSPIGMASCTEFVLWHRTGQRKGATGATGHQLAVVAYRDGWLY